MANVGLKKFLYGVLTESASGNTYGIPAKLAGAIEIKDSPNINEANLYADDEIVESDYSVSNGTLTLGIDNDEESVFGPLLGKAEKEISVGTEDDAETVKEYTSSGTDIGKYVGFGYIKRKIISGKDKYVVVFYPKVKFKPFQADAKTKGEKLEFTTPSVEGKYFDLSGSGYKKEIPFATLANAVTHLNNLFKPAA